MTDTTQTAPEAPSAPSPQPEPFQSPTFISLVQAFIKGDKKPKSPQSDAILDKIKESVAKQDALIQRGKKIEEEMKKAQGEAAHLAGKLDGLLSVLYGFEGTTAE